MFWAKIRNFVDKMGLEIISDYHLNVHVVEELIQIFKLWFFRVAIFDFSKGLTQDHSQIVSSKSSS